MRRLWRKNCGGVLKMKKLYVNTFGCQMNVYDSAKMADLMKLKGYEITEIAEEADMAIINTCHIREKVKEKIFTELGKLKKLKNKKIKLGGYMVIAVTGCVAQTQGKEIFRRMPIVDIVLGPGSYHELPILVEKVLEQQGFQTHNIKTEFLNDEKFDKLTISDEVKGVSEFITVQEGCDKFCSYCIVPYTRGREYSRKPENVMKEVLALVNDGVKEVTLLGQNVDNYKGVDEQGNTVSLAKLIEQIAKIDEIKRIRYMTSYPSQATQDLIDAHKNIDKLMPFIYLPIQSGSDKILKLMNRKYSVEDYKGVIEKLRKARPDIAISSDFIVGFAGETEEDFEQTLKLAKKIRFAQSFSFIYSPRVGTRGAEMPNQIHERVKAERLGRLQTLLNSQQLEFNQKFKGKVLPILVEGVSKKNKKLLFGKTPYMQSTVFECEKSRINGLIGEIIDVKIAEVNTKRMKGEENNQKAKIKK
jgi:tRNA-2-methylthio-N6-dimethylallyladenosine synthase